MEGFIWAHGECRGFSHCSTTTLVAFPSIKLWNLNGCTLFPKKNWTSNPLSKKPSWIHLVLGLFTRNPSLEFPPVRTRVRRVLPRPRRRWDNDAQLQQCPAFSFTLHCWWTEIQKNYETNIIGKFAGDDPFTFASVPWKTRGRTCLAAPPPIDAPVVPGENLWRPRQRAVVDLQAGYLWED